ncbi:NUDIX hydrolase [Pontibaca salina]|uniref:NUDIX hydrolase n=1 Tax=Pontibaca salina TaxID=2795731 RepID=A0A934HT14_9RHOB|nr:NUDIX hydrolase [Pontibaca salina]MBI6630000.1 NUDIX hydrolase [Pontibaca salina]
MNIDKTAVRNAATVIALRDRDSNPAILMGQRGAKAAFMPNKFVFPGGAVDQEDTEVPLATSLSELCRDRLGAQCDTNLQHALAAAAIRELWEETGLVLGRPGTWQGDVPPDWRSFAETGHVPTADGLQFVFRALTPPGRPRRFDARFFLVDAAHLSSDLDDFSHASDELSHLQWIELDRVRDFDLPFITEVVLAEVAARVTDPAPPPSVPFFRNDDEDSLFLRLYGRPKPAGR